MRATSKYKSLLISLAIASIYLNVIAPSKDASKKIIEEAPAIDLTKKIREKLFRAAIKSAKAIDYSGAGTIEFLYKDKQFYFMEMNTRLQVEHPVTEMITGLDLVEWQLLVASGQALPLTQKQIHCQGHAIEARIYAEDPSNLFLPSTGEIHFLSEPAEEDVRIDSGIETNSVVSRFYDPMLAKCIVHADTRELARVKMQDALRHYLICGPTTNINFLLKTISHESYIKADISTHFIDTHKTTLLAKTNWPPHYFIFASLFSLHQQKSLSETPWQINDAWRPNLAHKQILQFVMGDQLLDISINIERQHYTMTLFGNEFRINNIDFKEPLITFTMHEQQFQARVLQYDNKIYVMAEQGQASFKLFDPIEAANAEQSANPELNAPMPGTIVAIFTSAGSKVMRGSDLLVLEAMKMEHTIHAPSDGLVKQVHFGVGDQVAEGEELLVFEPTS